MELNLTHEMISINETIFDGMVEQPVELDYTLPDYYPSIFKVLKCRICPKVYSCRTSGDKLVIDGVISLKLLYLDEDSNQIHSIEQKQPFSKTVDMRGEAHNPVISYSAKGDYINCRVINPRRIDLRGAASIYIKVCEQQEEQVVAGAEGMGMQLNKSSMSMGSEHLWATKQFSIEEQLDVGYGKPPVGEILACEATAFANDCKVISNKIVTKGEVCLHILYRPDSDDGALQVTDQTIQISQIIDLPGVDESYQCSTTFDVTSIRVEPDNDAEGTIHVELDITACCDAFRNKEMQGVCDAFSTLYETALSAKEVRTEKLLSLFSDTVSLKEVFEVQNLQEVCDVWCTVSNLIGTAECESIGFTADLNAVLIGLDNENLPCAIEKTIPIEFRFASETPLEPGAVVIAHAEPCSAEASLNGNSVELRVSLYVCGRVCAEARTRVLTDISADDARPKEKAANCALTIYYADGGEQVWDIAKRYNTSVSAIMEENNLDGDTIREREMILIPIVE